MIRRALSALRLPRWPGALPGPVIGGDPAAWLARREACFPDLTPGTEKALQWACAKGQRTALAVVYIHGFSASRQEISPVPEQIAQTIGANFFAMRLAGHGRDGAALGQASLPDWAIDLAEGMATARLLGERTVLIGTSTGASLATLAALEPSWQADIAALILISPNYALRNPMAWMLDLPLAPLWLPWLTGREQQLKPLNPAHARYWTLSYPTAALFALRAAQQAAVHADHGKATAPLLVFMAESDSVVRPDAIRRVVSRWGAPSRLQSLDTAEDPLQHVITGAIRSPGTTDHVIEASLHWLNTLPRF